MTSVIALSNIDFLVGKAYLWHDYVKGCAARTISSACGRCSNTLVFFYHAKPTGCSPCPIANWFI